MANTIVNAIPFIIQGDGVSISVQVQLGYAPTSVVFVSAFNTNTGANVSSNVASVTIGASVMTINFVAGFAYTVTILVNILPTQPIPSTQMTTVSDLSGSNITVEMLATQRRQLAELTAIRKGIEVLIGRMLLTDFEGGDGVFVG